MPQWKALKDRYQIELLIVLSGVIVAVLEATLASHSDVGIVVASLGLMLALVSAAIRQEIDERIGDAESERAMLAAIPDAEWRMEAHEELENTRRRLRAWSTGTRSIDADSSLRVQIDALHEARRASSRFMWHFDPDSIDMMANRQRGFNSLMDAYRNLGADVVSKRILILDASNREICADSTGARRIVNPAVRELCETNISPRSEGGLGFDLRIHWVTGRPRTSDHLIIDQYRAYAIDALGNGQFGNLEESIDAAVIARRCREFDALWVKAVDANAFLGPPGDSGRPS